MSMLQIAQGLSAFIGAGLRPGDAARPAVGNRQGEGEPGGTRQVIDVEATPIEPGPARTAKQTSARGSAARNDFEPQVASYAPPTQRGQAPRLHYMTQPRGQVFESWA